MRRIIPLILIIGVALLSACNPQTEYRADYDRYIVTDLTATAGDEDVLLQWKMKEGWTPIDYQISYNDAGGNKVQKRTGSTSTSFVVDELENNVNYVFSVQAVYSGDRLSGSVKASATPVTSRLPVKNYKLEASDKKIKVTWTSPGGNCTGISLICKANGEIVYSEILPASSTQHVIDGLSNYQEYEVIAVAIYDKGLSEDVSAKATPIGGSPLCYVQFEEVYSGQINTFTFNLNDYPTATDIKWTFDDGKTLSGARVEYRIWGKEKAQVILNVNINGTPVEYKFYLSVREYAVNINTWSDAGIKFKNTHFAFSPDRKTAYILSYGSARMLEAISLESGKEKWSFNLGGGQGNGAHFGVNPLTGDVVVSSDSKLFCISEEGMEKWSISGFGQSCGVGAAFSPDASIIYIGTTSGVLWAIKASDGSQLGSVELGGNLSSMVVDGSTLFVTIRLNADPNVFFFDVSNPSSIKTVKTLKFESRGSDICSASVAPDKKTLYFSADQYFYCVDLSTKEIVNSVKTSDGANYLVCGSVVAPNGDVAVVYASTTSQSYMSLFSAGLAAKKWDWYPESHKNTFNYNCPAVDIDGNFYVADRTGKMWCVSPDGSGTQIFAGPQALQGATGMCDNLVLTAGNAAPGAIVAKCVAASRAVGWSGTGGDPCCTKCIQWAYKQ